MAPISINIQPFHRVFHRVLELSLSTASGSHEHISKPILLSIYAAVTFHKYQSIPATIQPYAFSLRSASRCNTSEVWPFQAFQTPQTLHTPGDCLTVTKDLSIVPHRPRSYSAKV
jgi:hypothetical protein